jgi:hypothetical protein
MFWKERLQDSCHPMQVHRFKGCVRFLQGFPDRLLHMDHRRTRGPIRFM